MSRLKIAYLLDAAIAIALVIIIPLLLDNTFAPANSLAYYLVAKIILGVIFLAAIAYGLLGKGANGSNTTIVAVATAYQLVPLLVRFLVLSKIPHADIIVVVTIAILTIAFIGLAFGLSYQDSKMIAREEKAGNEIVKEDVAYAFQETALNMLIGRTLKAVEDLHPAMVITAGGVAANSRLRVMLAEGMKKYPDIELSQPPIKYCTDNAAMIGASGYVAYKHKLFGTFDVAADPGLMMPGEE